MKLDVPVCSLCEICGIAKFQLFWNCSKTSIEKKIL